MDDIEDAKRLRKEEEPEEEEEEEEEEPSQEEVDDLFADIDEIGQALAEQAEERALKEVQSNGKGQELEEIEEMITIIAVREEGAGVFTIDNIAITVSNAIAPSREPIAPNTKTVPLLAG